ncbi:oligosaccharide flippase family protein [Candidatus Roizmanbacteria bacterium]|nr:oligosaccharide flippase family protein [Candidatus Roizmanbacteria bacterium]
MEETEIALIKGKIVNGVLALTSRTFILQIITLVSTFLLGILLTSQEFGIYWVVLAVISFLSYFSDIGLAAALIQKKTTPERNDLVTAFTVQQLLAGSIFVMMLIIAPMLSAYYQIGNSGLFLLRALTFSFLLASLKTIPSVLLERKLEFKLLIIPQILETGVFYLTTIILATLGFGVASFAWGAIVRAVVGLVAIFIVSPWRIGIGISWGSLKELLSFGTPFQANSLLALIKDDLMTIFLGKILPFSEVGYLGWAKKWSEVHLRLIMDSVIRVTFPTFSRLQEDKKILAKALSKSLFFLSYFIFPTTGLLILCVKPLIYIVPRYIKWEPALNSFYLFTFSSMLAAFSSPMVNALNALGKIKISLLLMIMWTVLTWALILPLISIFGFQGVAISLFIISFTSVFPVILMRKYVYFPVLTSIYKPFLSTLIIFLPLYLIINSLLSIFGIVISVMTMTLLYLSITYLWMREEVSPYLPKFIRDKWLKG